MNVILDLENDFKVLHEKVDMILAYFKKPGYSSINETLYSNKELCSKLNVCAKTLHHYRKGGMIKFIQVGRKISYTESAVQEFLKKHFVNKKSN
jgi:hypothetical protein